MTGRNTSIAKSRLGPPRFPTREPEPPGKVDVYYWPVEEIIARYGPPKKPRRHSHDGTLDYRSVMAAIHTSDGPGEAASLLGVALDVLQQYIRLHHIQPRYGLLIKTKEDDEMGFEVYKDENCEGAASDRKKNVAAQALAKNKDEKQKEADPAGSRFTVARAVEIREETIEDLDDLNRLIDLATRDCAALSSDRVMRLLTWYRDQCRQTLDRIDKAFSSTEVII